MSPCALVPCRSCEWKEGLSVWGFQWAVAILEWLQSCRWPAQPKDGDPGISWAEIAVCLAMRQGHWLPVKRTHGTRELIMQLIYFPDMEDLQLTMGSSPIMPTTSCVNYRA